MNLIAWVYEITTGEGQCRSGLAVESTYLNPEGPGSSPRLGIRRSCLVSIEHHAELLVVEYSLVGAVPAQVTMALHVHCCGLGQLSPLYQLLGMTNE